MRADVNELVEIVDAARRATKSLSDPELHRIAFERVLDHLLTNSTTSRSLETIDSASSQQASEAPDADGVFADEQQRVDAIARYFEIDPDEVEHIFDTSNEQPDLRLHTSRFKREKAGATREIALLLAGARTALGQDTTMEQIRSVASRFGRLDPSNFAKTLAGMRDVSVLGRPQSPNRVVRMKVLGAEKAQELAKKLIDG